MKFNKSLSFDNKLYSLGPIIGEGSYGKVHLAKVTENGKSLTVAIKILKKNDAVLQEIQMMQALKHQNIVQLYEVIETSKKVYIVMQFIMGGDLLEKITNNGPMTEEEAKETFREIIAAVGYCHGKGYAHRDLKLENILLRKDGHVKIADFGFAVKMNNDNDMHSTICGSGIYTAPEVLEGKAYNPKVADIFSLGVILYAMIYGCFPNQPANNVCFPESNVSESCKNLISQMLNKNVEQRATLNQILNYLN